MSRIVNAAGWIAALTGAGLGGWAWYHLLAQYGRLLLRIEALERAAARPRQLDDIAALGGSGAMLAVPLIGEQRLVSNSLASGEQARPAGPVNQNALSTGAAAPSFRLPRVDGGELSLDELRGHRVLLVFSDPSCEPCSALARELEALQRRSPGVQVVMVSRGDAGSNRAMVSEYGLTFPVLVQRRWEVSREYGTFAIPSAFVIDGDGTIEAGPAADSEAILALAADPSTR